MNKKKQMYAIDINQRIIAAADITFIVITNQLLSPSNTFSMINAIAKPNPQNRFMLILYINVIRSLTVSSPVPCCYNSHHWYFR
ncbi:hypothetical protein ACK4QX_21740, partial [Proteus mirabilis]|uniref:hypothetical protein n=1 Tax=Proteus mirabilis TaxID=584 RepID=UPI00391C3C77